MVKLYDLLNYTYSSPAGHVCDNLSLFILKTLN